MRMISSVPRLCWEPASGRIVSSVTTPPALRMTCASPSFSPRTFVGISRASMHATTASLRPGGIGRSPLSKLEEYCSALRRTSSVVLIGWTLLRPRRVVLGVDLREALPLVGQLVLGEARVHGARLDARVAVDALLRVDVELLDAVVVGLVRRRVDAVHRAHLDAGVVLGADAGLRDHVGHAPKHMRDLPRSTACPRRPNAAAVRAAQATGGRRSAHGRAASSCADSASSGPSPAGRPKSWTPTGRPSCSDSGSEIAGCPVTFATAVNGVNAAERVNRAIGSSVRQLTASRRTGASDSAGATTRS